MSFWIPAEGHKRLNGFHDDMQEPSPLEPPHVGACGRAVWATTPRRARGWAVEAKGKSMFLIVPLCRRLV